MQTTFNFVQTLQATEKKRYKVHATTPDSLIAWFLKNGHAVGPKEGTGIIAARFEKDSNLESKNVIAATGLILDFDGKYRQDGKVICEVLDADAIIAKLPFRGVAHTSFTHTPELPKFRIILPLAEEVSPKDFNRLWWWVYELTDRKADPACKNPDRMFYLPRTTKEALEQKWPWVREMKGPLLSLSHVPTDFIAQAPLNMQASVAAAVQRRKQGAHFAAPETRYHHADAQKLIDTLLELPIYRWALENPSALSREVWRGLATNLGAIVVEDESAYDAASEAFHKVSEPDPSRYNWGVTERTFRDAVKSAKSPGPMTYESLIQNGAPEDCQQGDSARSPIAHARHKLREKEALERPKPTAPSPAETKASEGAPGASLAKAASSTKSKPVEDDEGDDEEGGITFNIDPDNFLLDLQAGWLIKHVDAQGRIRWSNPIDDAKFNHVLRYRGLAKKHLDNYKSTIRPIEYRELVLNTTEYFIPRGDHNVLNVYQPSEIQPAPGNWDDIQHLILNLVGDDLEAYEYVLDWLALPLQHVRLKGEHFKMFTALVFAGEQGSGKGTLAAVMEALYGPAQFVELGQDTLDGRFNGMLAHKLFVVANEVMSSTNRSGETANKIKPWITDHTIHVEEKYQGRHAVKNTFNIVFASNDERPVLLEKSDRRFSVFTSKALQREVGRRIKADLDGPRTQVSAFLDFLLQRKTKVQQGDLYHSKARVQMMRASAHSEEKFVCDIIEDGLLAVAQPWVDNAPSGKIREVVVEGNHVLSSTLQELYRDYCVRHGLKNRSAIALGKALATIPEAVGTRIRYGNTQVRAWVGIPLLPPDTVAEVVSLPTPKVNNPPTPPQKKAEEIDDAGFDEVPKST